MPRLGFQRLLASVFRRWGRLCSRYPKAFICLVVAISAACIAGQVRTTATWPNSVLRVDLRSTLLPLRGLRISPCLSSVDSLIGGDPLLDNEMRYQSLFGAEPAAVNMILTPSIPGYAVRLRTLPALSAGMMC